MTCAGCFGKFCVALKVIALIFHIVAIGLPYWYKGDTTETAGLSGTTVKTTVREGLWKKCTDLDVSDSNSNSFCEGNEATDAIIGIRWVMFIAAGVQGIAILATGAGHLEKNRTAFIVGAVHSFVSSVLNAVNAILYATVVKDNIGFELKHLYIGWGLLFISMCLQIVGGVMAIILSRMAPEKKDDDDTN